MEGKLNVATALDEAFRIIDQLVDCCDMNGLDGEKPVEEGRDFAERLLKFARYRRCCHNCTHCRPDEGALHVGKTEDPLACFAARPPFYIEETVHGGLATQACVERTARSTAASTKEE